MGLTHLSGAGASLASYWMFLLLPKLNWIIYLSYCVWDQVTVILPFVILII